MAYGDLNKYMDAVADLGRNPVSKNPIQSEYGDEHADAGGDCRTRLAGPSSRVQTGTGKYLFPCSDDHKQDWHLTWLILTLAIRDDHTYIHTYIQDLQERSRMT